MAIRILLTTLALVSALAAQEPSTPPAAGSTESKDQPPKSEVENSKPDAGTTPQPETSNQKPETVVAPVVVTATRRAADPFDVPASVSILDLNELQNERMVRTIPEAVSAIPGILGQSTSRGHGSPFIRGFTGFRNVLLVDGIRINNSIFREGPNQYWNTVDPYLAERVEVIRGPGSVLYGSDALGGVVQVFARERRDFEAGLHANPRAVYRFGSADESNIGRAELTANAGEHWGIAGGGTMKHFNDVVAGRGTGELPNTGYGETDADVKATYRFDDKRRLVFAYQNTEQEDVPRTHSTLQAVPYRGSTVGSLIRRDFDQRRDMAYAQYHAEGQGGVLDGVHASVSWMRQREHELQVRRPSGGPLYRVQDEHQEVDTFGAWVQFETPSKVGTWTYGAEYYRDYVDTDRADRASTGVVTVRPRGPLADESTADLLGVYLQDELSVTDACTLTLGGRFNWNRIDAGDVDPVPTDAVVFDSFTEDYAAFAGSARVLYALSDNWHVWGGAAQGFRAPNLDDTTAFRDVTTTALDTPSPDLDPETTYTFEIGAQARYKRLDLQATYYYTILRDFIRRLDTGTFDAGRRVFRKDNFSDGFVEGVESSADFHVTDEWTVFGGFAWLAGESDAVVRGAEQKDRLTRLAPISGIAGVRFHEPVEEKYWVEGYAQCVGHARRLSAEDNADTERIPPGGLPGYTIFGIRAGWKVHQNATVSLSVENLTNKNYRVLGSGQNEPGTNAVAGVDIHF